MKIPRDLNSDDIIKLLKPFGYKSTRQAGSHIRLTTEENGQHHITVPHHDPIKVGTLSAILGEVAKHLNILKKDFLLQLFG